ncbi:transposase [Saccharothrix deserti]|uniref:transposase n=1 Tax=Saccharothrix deserti TaxID=2593674 RepID=UPI001EE4D627|nr:transposase [Saccharothrix deserti]
MPLWPMAHDYRSSTAQGRILAPHRVAQAAKNLVIDLEDAGIRVVLTGVRIPWMNAIMERWIQSCRRELLDRTLIWNQRHLLHVLREYEQFYNTHRPHQGIGNARPLRALPQPTADQTGVAQLDIRRQQRLGGILSEYHHAAWPVRTAFSASAGPDTFEQRPQLLDRVRSPRCVGVIGAFSGRRTACS